MELIIKLRAQIKEYRVFFHSTLPAFPYANLADETLLLHAEVANPKHPNKRALEAYRYWFSKPYPALGVAKTALDNVNTSPEKTTYTGFCNNIGQLK